jgi:outer membrane protein OmpA-like peptidoglycan-associated protein
MGFIFMKFKKLLVFLAIFGLFCSGVSRGQARVLPKSLDYGQLCSQRVSQALLSSLKQSRVQVSLLGDHIFFSVPSDRIFYRNSTRLRLHRINVLDKIVRTLKCYQKVSVKVVAYANVLKSEQENSSFALLQAKQVSNYLWRKNIGAQLIYSEGIGGLKGSRRNVGYVQIITQKLP